MGLRITTWNVNGIRNPFGYQPWRDQRSFAAMFDILEADIVIFQETKIQRKDLVDDMVLVPGWDCYFSLPRYKKGYSGVVVYTRQSVCAPIRAEEGITGILCPPNSITSFTDLPEDQQIGGYPTSTQLSGSTVDAATLDSEGRCVILEFPAFVLFGVYSPANRDEARDDFRLSFLDMLDARIRNIIAMGKRVVLTGDLNISREELDTANAEANMRKQGLTAQDFVSTPARRLFNHLLEGGKIFGGRDEGRENAVMWDICRAFHPGRKGMFTCWEQKVNARPGNCGARIDYVLCSLAMKDWFCESNIQEGLMGSDHCPVYAVIKDKILIDGEEHDVQDVMNPPGMFSNGMRQRDYSTTADPLPMSGKLIPEFFGRRNIRDMFSRKPSLAKPQNSATSASSPSPSGTKRGVLEEPNSNSIKRVKPGAAGSAGPASSKGQQSLKGFFKSKAPTSASTDGTFKHPCATQSIPDDTVSGSIHSQPQAIPEGSCTPDSKHVAASLVPSSKETSHKVPGRSRANGRGSAEISPTPLPRSGLEQQDSVHDPIESKESWSKLFTKPAAPRCEGHDEPCISLLTKKPGMNLGRSFWMCSRPLGPSGAKEKNTQWRCQTFIWCSDWNSSTMNVG